jgi:hypothetical protein
MADAVVPKTKGLNCPSCGAALEIRGFEHTLTIVCGHCHSILDARDPNLQILQQFKAAQKYEPAIPLGTRGLVGGNPHEVIGFQRRTTVVEGTEYSWYEYLLFNPYHGYRYLTHYNGHWNLVRTLRALPEQVAKFPKPTFRYQGERYLHFQTATASTTYVLGEFPWQVRVNDSISAMDAIHPPKMLSAETTENETTWSLGQYVSGSQVWQMFKLAGSPPAAIGVFENQPSPYGQSRKLWRTCLALLLAVLFLDIFFSIFSPKHTVFNSRYQFDPRSPGEHSFVTDAFEIGGHPSNVQVMLHTDLRNNWAYFNLALINDQTGHAYNFGHEVSYESGYDSDGHWTEGRPDDQVIVPSLPAGRYYLRVEPEMDARAAPMQYALLVRTGVPAGTFYWIAAILLVIPPVLLSFRAISFEHQRWAESDYGTSGFTSSSADSGD